MRWVLLRARDKHGRLRRSGRYPPGVEVDDEGNRVVSRPVAYETMYRQVLRRRGRRRQDVDAAWRQFLRRNPKFGKGGDL